jgi:hypothetical protein
MRRCDARITRTDQVVAYAGLDIEVKQSGKWKGQAKRVLARQWASATHPRAFQSPAASACQVPPLEPTIIG